MSKKDLKLDEELFEKPVEVNRGEAMLIDWVLTLHSLDITGFDWLKNPDIKCIRSQAGEAIVKDGGTLHLEFEDILTLLVLIPITFRFDRQDVGYSLKEKLYKAYLNIGKEAVEDVEATDEDKGSPSEDQDSDYTEADGSPGAGENTFLPR